MRVHDQIVKLGHPNPNAELILQIHWSISPVCLKFDFTCIMLKTWTAKRDHQMIKRDIRLVHCFIRFLQDVKEEKQSIFLLPRISNEMGCRLCWGDDSLGGGFLLAQGFDPFDATRCPILHLLCSHHGYCFGFFHRLLVAAVFYFLIFLHLNTLVFFHSANSSCTPLICPAWCLHCTTLGKKESRQFRSNQRWRERANLVCWASTRLVLNIRVVKRIYKQGFGGNKGCSKQDKIHLCGLHVD